MIFSLVGFVLIYTTFAVVEVYLMLKFIRKGPEPVEHDPLQYDAAPATAGTAH
jgi:cytochrome d ubiquinol oxidase subunit I